MSMLELVVRSCLGQDDLSYKFKSCYSYLGGYSSIGRIAECGTVGSLFNPGCSPLYCLSIGQDSSIGQNINFMH